MESKITWVVCLGIGGLFGAAVAHKMARMNIHTLQAQLEHEQQTEAGLRQELVATKNDLDKAKEQTDAEAVAAAANQTKPVSDTPSKSDDDDDVKRAKTLLVSELKDPSSAVFGDVKVRINNGNKYACGMFNAKNSYGGYTGMQQFVVDFSAIGHPDRTAVTTGDTARFLWMVKCN